MEFRKCTINGKVYGANGFSPESEGARGARLRREKEMAAANGGIEAETPTDAAEEEREFLEKRALIFEEYKSDLRSLFQPKYSSLDIDKLTFADPEVFKDLKFQGYEANNIRDSSSVGNSAPDIKDIEQVSISEVPPANSRQKQSVMDFFTAIALCHTAVVEKIDKQGQVIDESLQDELEEGTAKAEPDIIHEDGQMLKSGSKASAVNDSLEASNPSIAVTSVDDDGSGRQTPASSSATKRSRFRNALHKHKLRITNRSSRLPHLRSDRRGSRGEEFDSIPGQKARNVDTTVEEQLAYKSESPDESALVTAVKNLGFTFLKKKGTVLTVDILGKLYDFELLNVIEFNSTRKRMSVIVRRPEPWSDIVLYCKGADNVIIERLKPGQDNEINQVTKDIDDFSNEGLRTLTIACKTLTEEEYSEWSGKLHTASTSTENRAEHIESVNELIEHGFTLLGATAIEDKLQDQVPDCIESLRQAGIKVWVLTGDKVETAINIGYASNLLGKESKLWIVRGSPGAEETLKNFEDMISEMEQEREDNTDSMHEDTSNTEKPRQRNIKEPVENALIIDGLALKHLFETEESKARLLQVVLVCKSVVCCRVSPLQKALVVELVRRGQGAVTLAVGDGANDVSMIQAANIGVGIAGQEGAQASMSADYAIGQFRFLKKLLLVQGHWSYDRISEMILNFFYKNVVWVFGGLWYQIFCGFSANIFYDYSFLQLYNLIFTVAPTCVIGKS
jgi:phospholipid-translocating ATPase